MCMLCVLYSCTRICWLIVDCSWKSWTKWIKQRSMRFANWQKMWNSSQRDEIVCLELPVCSHHFYVICVYNVEALVNIRPWNPNDSCLCLQNVMGFVLSCINLVDLAIQSAHKCNPRGLCCLTWLSFRLYFEDSEGEMNEMGERASGIWISRLTDLAVRSINNTRPTINELL